ncbi:putative transcriptional regulator, TetR family protein [Mycobacterium intracellulare]|nr:putative transcriptional regulator, TetR family protein [Mycobacterium avium subsp. hominissuis]BBZ47559.1 putative transcriptional regulator, TetR family protein [Mycobacterium parmense]BCO60853.1 putative transcriptional regulator, TetR family protein [Mycobacterium intracellulare]GFG66530.1 putative transcriptional regulator, TetR family protein [Mycobacterium kubicae]BCO71607.1 putative transcriptional regulator, TetR family protein [Mycobacterium intracellulare]
MCKTHILLTMPTESVRLSFRRHMREQVLRAARTLTIEKGWDRVRMGEVAELVGVSRPTLYKEFTDKQGLGDALVVAEGERFLNGIHAVLAQHAGDVGGGITAAVSYTLKEAEASPLLKAVLTSNRPTDRTVAESTGMLPLLPTSASLLELSSAALVTWFNEHFSGLDANDVNDVADALVRLTVSHVVLPTADAETTGERISRIALRYLGVHSSAGEAR